MTLVLERAFPTRDSLKPVDRGLQQHYHLRYALAGIQFAFCTANLQTSQKFFRINDSESKVYAAAPIVVFASRRLPDYLQQRSPDCQL